jgi:hypothetical protein
MTSVQVWEPQVTRRMEVFRGVVRRFPGGALAVAGMERVDRVVEQVPVLAWVRTRLYELEDDIFLALRDRLTTVDGTLSMSTLVPFAPASRQAVVPATSINGPGSPADAFAILLGTSETQSPDAARRQNVMRLIDELVPDEARILFAMSDGSQYAVLQAMDGDDHILVNQSNVGRGAKVHAQDQTTAYVTHLLHLGLVELVPYEGRSFYEWEMIETETHVREVLARYDHRKLRKPKVIRQILRLSPAGRAFCDRCIPA